MIRETPQGEGSTHRSSLPPEVREALIEGQRGIVEAREWLQTLTPPCPQCPQEDGTKGVFARFEGSYTRGYVIYSCPKGHEFHRGATAALPQR